MRVREQRRGAAWLVLGLLMCYAALALLASSCAPSLQRRLERFVYTTAGYFPGMTLEQVRLAVIERHVRLLGFTVTYDPTMDPDMAGHMNEAGEIVVNAAFGPNDRAITVLHEAAHRYGRMAPLDSSEHQLFAEAVGTCAAKRYGLNLEDVSARYLASFKTRAGILRLAESEIKWACAVLAGPKQ